MSRLRSSKKSFPQSDKKKSSQAEQYANVVIFESNHQTRAQSLALKSSMKLPGFTSV